MAPLRNRCGTRFKNQVAELADATDSTHKWTQRWDLRETPERALVQASLALAGGLRSHVSHLKNPFSLWRAFYKGERGFQRYVGWSVITKNLLSLARWQERKKRAQEKRECRERLKFQLDSKNC